MTPSRYQCPSIDDVGLRSLIWIFVGLVYGFLFVLVAELSRHWLGAPWHVPSATVGAATLTALVYGSMRLVVLIANLTLAFTLLVLLLADDQVWLNQQLLIVVPALLGLVVGAVYGWRDRASRVCCAEAKILAGLFAGGVTLLPAMLLIWVIGLDVVSLYPWGPMLLAPIAGAVYVGSACWFVGRFHQLLPPFIDGAIVGGGVGALTGLVFALIDSAFATSLPSSSGLDLGPVFAALQETLALGLLGAAAGCLLLGVLRSFLRARWYRL